MKQKIHAKCGPILQQGNNPKHKQLASVSVIDREEGNDTPPTDDQFATLAPDSGILRIYTCDLPDNRAKGFQFGHTFYLFK